jgi:hypothetical protein
VGIETKNKDCPLSAQWYYETLYHLSPANRFYPLMLTELTNTTNYENSFIQVSQVKKGHKISAQKKA